MRKAKKKKKKNSKANTSLMPTPSRSTLKSHLSPKKATSLKSPTSMTSRINKKNSEKKLANSFNSRYLFPHISEINPSLKLQAPKKQQKGRIRKQTLFFQKLNRRSQGIERKAQPSQNPN
jgi:hypothetical protein